MKISTYYPSQNVKIVRLFQSVPPLQLKYFKTLSVYSGVVLGGIKPSALLTNWRQMDHKTENY